jgi:hypothetical protein
LYAIGLAGATGLFPAVGLGIRSSGATTRGFSSGAYRVLTRCKNCGFELSQTLKIRFSFQWWAQKFWDYHSFSTD